MDTHWTRGPWIRMAVAAFLGAMALLTTAREVSGGAPQEALALTGRGQPPAAPGPALLPAPAHTPTAPFLPFDAVACRGSTLPDDPLLAEVSRALNTYQREPALQLLDSLEPDVREGAARDSSGAVAQHRLAAVLGARATLEGGRARIRAARELHAQVDRVLALDPEHAGAHHILGRLHAGVMRLDRLTRFLATRLLGGGALAGASWEAALEHLALAELREPCRPEHHLELARLHLDLSRLDDALSEVGHALELTGAPDEDWGRLRQAAGDLLAELEEEVLGERHESRGSLSLPAPPTTPNPSGGESLAHPSQRRRSGAPGAHVPRHRRHALGVRPALGGDRPRPPAHPAGGGGGGGALHARPPW